MGRVKRSEKKEVNIFVMGSDDIHQAPVSLAMTLTAVAVVVVAVVAGG